MNIYEKIMEVMKNIEYLTKDDKVEFGNTKYKAISEEKVTTAVRKELIKQGIVIIPILQESKVTELIRTEKSVNQRADVHTRYRIQNVEDVNDFIEVESNGSGVDTQDKAIGKAMTYAYKYMLLRTFAIPTGEDPDKVSSAETDAKIEKEIETLGNKTIDKMKADLLNQAIEKNHIKDEVVEIVLANYGYTNTNQIKNKDYEKIVDDLKEKK